MRALVISPEPFFSPRGTPFSVYYRTLIEAESGVNIDLLTYGQGEDVDISGVRIIRIPRFKFLGPIKIGPSFHKLFLDVFILLWAVGLLIRYRYDYVHAHEESVFFCRFLKPIFRFKYVYDMHSSLPQQLTNFKFTTSRILIGLFRRLENTCLKKADAVITICPDLAKYVVERVPNPKKHFLIENSIFDPVRLKNNKNNQHWLSPEARLPKGRPIVAYAGTFEPYQGLDVLISAFAEVYKHRPDAFLLMIGGMPKQVEKYRAFAYERGLKGHCMFTGRIDQESAKNLLASADVLTSPRIDGTNTPLKIYEQLESGKPLVATRIYSHTQVLTDKVCFLVDPDPESMAKGILEALNDKNKVCQIVEQARKLYGQAYSRPVYEGKVHRLLEVLS